MMRQHLKDHDRLPTGVESCRYAQFSEGGKTNTGCANHLRVICTILQIIRHANQPPMNHHRGVLR